MRSSAVLYIVLLFSLPTCAQSVAAPDPAMQPCPADAGWSDPARPAHVYANTWYVGTCGISAILVTSPDGHVLIDGATEQAAPMIEANVRALGCRVEDIRYLLNSHAHLDHAGGLARLAKDSGATLIALEASAKTLEHGASARDDPQFGELGPFPALRDVRRIADRETVTVGKLVLTAHATPGHTAGSTSWTWTACENGDCRAMVYADSVSAVSAEAYRYSDEQAHPGVVDAFRNSLDRIAALPCDILMTPHPSASRLFARLGPSASEALIDPTACARYAGEARQRLQARLDKEKDARQP
jgi:metallo-beta-lactamase class B